MYKFIIKRLLALIPVLICVVLLIYAIMEFTPGDPAVMTLGGMASEEQKAEWREEQGLNKSFLIRYADYVIGMVQGDLGTSYRTSKPVWQEIISRLPATVELAVASILIALILAVPIGIISAIRQNTIFDYTGMVAAMLGIAMPSFWLGMLLILLFSVNLSWLPSGGYGSFKYLVLPAITMGTCCAANIARITRSSMLEIIRQDYIRTARAKGVSSKKVILKHALKNSWIPIITVAGLQFGTLLGGIVVVENVFAWPGLGNYLLTSINGKDTPAVLGSIVVFTAIFGLVNLLVDIIYAFVDPRIKAQYSR